MGIICVKCELNYSCGECTDSQIKCVAYAQKKWHDLSVLNQKHLAKLDEYQATGKTPEQVAEWAKAEQEGRTVPLLPCKVGDSVWLLLESVVDEVFEIVPSRCVKYVNILSAMSNPMEWWSFFIDNLQIGNSLEFYRKDFGKTVFITEEEAQAKLAEFNKCQ